MHVPFCVRTNSVTVARLTLTDALRLCRRCREHGIGARIVTDSR